tara:strand:+ start:1518 stop:2561 length:1044 start_codon:yes stop_codon:yes gene_type:complete
MRQQKEIAVGTVRIAAKGSQAFMKTKRGWRKCANFSSIKKVVKLYKTHKNFKFLLDPNSKWLKGQLLDGRVQGARVKFLPNGEEVDKAFSLFAKNLRFHDQLSHDHWDVLFQNAGGTWAYCYSMQKKNLHVRKKFRKVHEFEKVHGKLMRNVANGLRNKNDHLAVPIFTMLKTYMRVGNEVYFNAHGHKGLTTLKKGDISIKGSKVSFNYLAKDGVPRLISEKFPKVYINRLRGMLKGKSNSDFVFTSCSTGRPLPEQCFKRAFLKYSGKEFYPHIIRSHYATSTVSKFIKGRRRISKVEADGLFYHIAQHLGHRKFLKGKWKDNFAVTVNHYIQPELVAKVKRMIR